MSSETEVITTMTRWPNQKMVAGNIIKIRSKSRWSTQWRGDQIKGDYCTSIFLL